MGARGCFAGGCSGRVEVLADGTRGGAFGAGAKRPRRRRGRRGFLDHLLSVNLLFVQPRGFIY